MKKSLVLMLVFLIVFGTVVTNAAFSDVESHWAKTFITELTNKKILNGYPDGTFRPNNVLTKGEYIKLIMQASLPEFDFLNASILINSFKLNKNNNTIHIVINDNELIVVGDKMEIICKEIQKYEVNKKLDDYLKKN